ETNPKSEIQNPKRTSEGDQVLDLAQQVALHRAQGCQRAEGKAAASEEEGHEERSEARRRGAGAARSVAGAGQRHAYARARQIRIGAADRGVKKDESADARRGVSGRFINSMIR